jgi:hypothetical protein
VEIDGGRVSYVDLSDPGMAHLLVDAGGGPNGLAMGTDGECGL